MIGFRNFYYVILFCMIRFDDKLPGEGFWLHVIGNFTGHFKLIGISYRVCAKESK